MKRLILLAIFFLLSGCGSPSRPEPQIITKEVRVAVPVPCPVKLPDRPVLLNKDEIRANLAAAANFDDRMKIVTEQLLLYIGWTPVVEAGLKGCGG